MPITKSAKKQAARSVKLRQRNNEFKLRMKMAMKKFKKNIENGDKVSIEELSLIYKHIDKCTKVGVIKKRNASRKKSNMAKLFSSPKIDSTKKVETVKEVNEKPTAKKTVKKDEK